MSRAIAIGAAAALLLPACGGEDEERRGTVAAEDRDAREPPRDDEGHPQRPAGEGNGSSEGPEGAPERDRRAPSADGGASTETGGCSFRAPPGRLAEREIAIELDGVGCDQGRSLARAAGLGQPAGANLTISRDGFECVPSPDEPGENTTYACEGRVGEVVFDVVWTR